MIASPPTNVILIGSLICTARISWKGRLRHQCPGGDAAPSCHALFYLAQVTPDCMAIFQAHRKLSVHTAPLAAVFHWSGICSLFYLPHSLWNLTSHSLCLKSEWKHSLLYILRALCLLLRTLSIFTLHYF